MYFDLEAAKAVQDNVYKLDLVEDPLVRLFEFGGGNGYWSGNHIIIQIEDVMDCLKHLHGDQYKYCFLFDHSSGHAKKRENGLDAKKMNVSWGGNMSMRNTHIESYHGFIGPYHDSSIEGMVTVGAEQTLTYESESDLRLGPFHISESEREAKRHDINFEISTEKQKAKQLTKTELVEKLMETEFGKVEGRVKLRSMKATELRTKAQQLGISVIQIQTHKTIRGWEHAPKGLLQVLWERGFIDQKNGSSIREGCLMTTMIWLKSCLWSILWLIVGILLMKSHNWNLFVSSWVQGPSLQPNIMQKWQEKVWSTHGHTVRILTEGFPFQRRRERPTLQPL
jgi:hypothetical protein